MKSADNPNYLLVTNTTPHCTESFISRAHQEGHMDGDDFGHLLSVKFYCVIYHHPNSSSEMALTQFSERGN